MKNLNKKKLTSLIGRMNKIEGELNVLLEAEKKLLENRDAVIDEDAEPKIITEADVDCLSEMIEEFANVGNTLKEHFQLE